MEARRRQAGAVGTNEALEKDFLRLTSMPALEAIRPPAVLRRALDMVKRKWTQVCRPHISQFLGILLYRRASKSRHGHCRLVWQAVVATGAWGVLTDAVCLLPAGRGVCVRVRAAEVDTARPDGPAHTGPPHRVSLRDACPHRSGNCNWSVVVGSS